MSNSAETIVNQLVALSQNQSIAVNKSRQLVETFMATLEDILLKDQNQAALFKGLEDLSVQYDEILSELNFERSQELNLADFQALINQLPALKESLNRDIIAAFEGDPAAASREEIIVSYPTVRILLNHRVAHLLYLRQVPLIPRLISEISHSKTGADINPGASVGTGCFIDHGTGIVIGETAVIGDNCRIYQGVTLGAKSFPKNEDGSLVKSIPRHPIVENNVVIYAGATILGRITIGHHSVIGGNVWITETVPAGSRVLQTRYQQNFFRDGEGI